MLRAICLNVKKLQSALIFGHHNVKTRPTGGRTNKRFQTKANLCISEELLLYKQTNQFHIHFAKDGDSDPPFPAVWSDPLVFSKYHYAPMHIIHWPCQK